MQKKIGERLILYQLWKFALFIEKPLAAIFRDIQGRIYTLMGKFL